MKPDVMIAASIGLGVAILAGPVLLPDLAEFVGTANFAGILGAVGVGLGLLVLQAYKWLRSQRSGDDI